MIAAPDLVWNVSRRRPTSTPSLSSPLTAGLRRRLT